MVHHLLKELSVGNQYKIDINSKFKSITCICCNEPIQDFGRYDDCSLGKLEVNLTCSKDLNLLAYLQPILSFVDRNPNTQ